ncbi:putative transposase, partial [Escherichia coli P0302293.9]
MPALNSGHTVSKISHPQLVRSFCHELTVYAVACGNGFPADG